jgi:hypothetical protein
MQQLQGKGGKADARQAARPDERTPADRPTISARST